MPDALDPHDLSATPVLHSNRDGRQPRSDVNLVDLVAFAHRSWRLMAYCLFLAFLAGAAYLVLVKPSYTATARLLIDPAKATPGQQSRLDPLGEKAYIDTQVEILNSVNLAQTVIRQFGLADDPELKTTGRVSRLLAWLPKALSSAPDTSDHVTPEAAAQAAALPFLDRTRVGRLGATYLVEVSYTSGDRGKAATVANAIAEAYVQGQDRDLRAELLRAVSTLEADINDLALRLRQAELAVTTHRARYGIAANASAGFADQQLADLDRRWHAAREAAELASATLARLRDRAAADPSGVADLAADLPNAATLARLARRYGEARATSGAGGLQGGNANGAQDGTDALREELLQEIDRALAAKQSAAEAAQRYEANLRRDLESALERLSESVTRLVERRDLEGRASVLRALHDERQRRRVEIAQQETEIRAPATIVSPASIPLFRSGPKVPLVLGLAGFLGAALGGGISFLRFLIDDSLHTRAEVREALGVNCLGVLPRLSRRRMGRKREARQLFLTAAAGSAEFSEALRAICIAANLHNQPQGPRTIGIASAMRREGRTLVAANLAQWIAASGHSVLLVDLDAQHPQLSREFAADLPFGLASAVAGKVSIEQAIKRNTPMGCDLLALVGQAGEQGATVLASPQRLKAEIGAVLPRYEYIVFDLPPCTATMDILSTSSVIRHFVLVIAAGRTRRRDVIDALEANPPMTSHLLAALLN